MEQVTSFLGLSLTSPLSEARADDGHVQWVLALNMQLLDAWCATIEARLQALEILSGTNGSPTIDGGTF